MKIYTNVLPEKRTSKPKNAEVGSIQNRCNRPSNIDLQELLKIISDGGTFRPAAINGTKAKGFVSSQLWAFDVDNTMSVDLIDEAGNPVKDENGRQKKVKQPLPEEDRLSCKDAMKNAQAAGFAPFAAYNTFSHTEDLEKFRVVFVGDRPVKSAAEWNYIYQRINKAIGESKTDPECKNAAHLFFGTDKGICYQDFKAVIQVDKALEGYKPPKSTQKTVKAQEKPHSAPQAAANNPDMDAIVDALIRRDAAYLKAAINHEHIVFKNRDEFFKYIYRKIDMAQFLHVRKGQKFRCVLPKHPVNENGEIDADPSANVFKTDRENGGVWKYKCFTEGKCLNLKRFIEAMCGFESTYQSLEFIKEIFNLEIEESEWSKEALGNIDDIITSTWSEVEGFAVECPTAASITRRGLHIFRQICQIARDTIRPEQDYENQNPVFHMSTRHLYNLTGKKSIGRTSEWINVFKYLDMVTVLPDEEAKAKKKTAFRNAISDKYKKHPNHVAFFELKPWADQQMQEIEDRAKRYKQIGYKKSCFGYEAVLRAEGQEVAAAVFPQTAFYKDKADGKVKQRQTGERSVELHTIISGVVLYQLQEYGYTTEARIIEQTRQEAYKTKVIIETQVKRSMPEILQAYGLKKVRCNKELKDRYGIDSKGYPTIIIQDT